MAASMIIIAFVWSKVLFDLIVFVHFYSLLVIFGSLRDYFDDTLHVSQGIAAFMLENLIFYPASAILYGLLHYDFSVFWELLCYSVTYSITKHFGTKYGYP